MDLGLLRRVEERLAGRVGPAETDAALERARGGLEALAETAAELETRLPRDVGEAVREGLRAEALPVARDLAEVRGLCAQVIRRLERLETELAAERHARVDDLAILVELIASGWQGADTRLARIEAALEPPSLARAS